MSRAGDRLARGTAYAVAAQAATAGFGFALTLVLARLLGPSLFGRYGLIISFLAWTEFLVINGIPEAVSRAVAADGFRRGPIFRAGLRLELLFAAALFGLFWLSAPWFSAVLFRNPSLAPAFRLAAIDIPLYALFSLHLGYLRGIRGFARQSLSLFFYAAVRLLGTTLLVLAGFSLSGALVGNALGSLAALVLARLLVNRDLHHEPRISHPVRPLLAYALPLVAGVLLYNALISIDLWMVERLVSDERTVGLYTAVWNMARTPYFLFMGLSVVLFPGLSRMLSAGEGRRVTDTLAKANQVFLLSATPLTLFIGLRAGELMELAFTNAYHPDRSGPLLAVLIAGYALLSFSLISNAALTAAGRLLLVIAVNLSLLLAQLILTSLLIPAIGLAGAALATMLAGGLSYLAGQVCLSRCFGRVLHWRTPLRAGLAAVPAGALLLLLPAQGLMLILAYSVCGLVYLAGLFFLGELTWDELTGYLAQFRSTR